MALAEGDDAYFELSFSPNVRLVTTVRRFVSSFYDQILEDADVTSRVAVATHELLENAVRYSTDGHTRVRVGVHRDSARTFTVTIETSNRTAPEHVVHLTTLMDEMKLFSDAGAFYQTLMGRSAKRTDGSGLGLGRIHAEAGMTLAHRVEEDKVHLEARGRFENVGRP